MGFPSPKVFILSVTNDQVTVLVICKCTIKLYFTVITLLCLYLLTIPVHSPPPPPASAFCSLWSSVFESTFLCPLLHLSAIGSNHCISCSFPEYFCMHNHIHQFFSNVCGLRTHSIIINMKLVRNANSWPHPNVTELETWGWGLAVCDLTDPGDSDAAKM